MTTHSLHNEHHHDDSGSKVLFGFWIYIMTDFIMFAALFATYIVLRDSTFGAIGIKQVANLPYQLVQTLILLASSLTYGFGYVSMHNNNRAAVMFWLVLTFILGLAFVGMGWHHLSCLVDSGNTWQTSGFLSVYFTLISIHGLHVIVGLLWIIILMIQMSCQNLSSTMKTRLSCLSLYWNYLNLVWLIIFTVVYLMGAI